MMIDRLPQTFLRAASLCAALFASACTATASAPAKPSSLAPVTETGDGLQADGLQTDGLKIQGTWIQGALLRGKVKPGCGIEFLGNTVYVDERGEFILGLGRDTPPQVDVIVTDPKQGRSVHTFAVNQRRYAIQRVEGVEEKFVTPSAEDLVRIEHDNRMLAAARSLHDSREDFANGFTWPLHGPITGVYGSQRFFNGVPKQPHYGMDISAPTGTPVHAPAGGKVTLAKDLYYSGWTLLIDHGQGLSSAFLHLSKILVKEGDTVKQGDLIGEVGATGRVTASHLDWRMNWLDQRLDVELLLPAQPDQ